MHEVDIIGKVSASSKCSNSIVFQLRKNGIVIQKFPQENEDSLGHKLYGLKFFLGRGVNPGTSSLLIHILALPLSQIGHPRKGKILFPSDIFEAFAK